MKRFWIGALCAGLALFSTGVTAARTSAQPAPRPGNDAPNFLSVCRYSHRAPDDPIVYPNQPGRSHSHDFFGNRTTNAFSTTASLQAGATTCARQPDTAAYWVPTLVVNGTAVTPRRVNSYYRLGGKDPRSITAFPSGLRVIAGDANATGPQAARGVTWSCREVRGSASPTSVPACPNARENHLVLRIRFPDCWNGRDLDSADHKSHMAYSERGRCPSTHPVPVPALSVNVHYPTAGGPGVTLASGAPYTAHADFFNAWNQFELERLVRECLNASVHCGARGPR